jgi:hypothetical protein
MDMKGQHLAPVPGLELGLEHGPLDFITTGAVKPHSQVVGGLSIEFQGGGRASCYRQGRATEMDT